VLNHNHDHSRFDAVYQRLIPFETGNPFEREIQSRTRGHCLIVHFKIFQHPSVANRRSKVCDTFVSSTFDLPHIYCLINGLATDHLLFHLPFLRPTSIHSEIQRNSNSAQLIRVAVVPIVLAHVSRSNVRLFETFSRVIRSGFCFLKKNLVTPVVFTPITGAERRRAALRWIADQLSPAINVNVIQHIFPGSLEAATYPTVSLRGLALDANKLPSFPCINIYNFIFSCPKYSPPSCYSGIAIKTTPCGLRIHWGGKRRAHD
jgi:hypothetical protein